MKYLSLPLEGKIQGQDNLESNSGEGGKEISGLEKIILIQGR